MKWISRLMLLVYVIIAMPVAGVLMSSMAYGLVIETIKNLQSK
jgi:hypothetical protein